MLHDRSMVVAAERPAAGASIYEILIASVACGALACAGAVLGFFLVCAFACEGPLLIAGSAFCAVGGLLGGIAVLRPLRLAVSE
jgi:hypothetical protein